MVDLCRKIQKAFFQEKKKFQFELANEIFYQFSLK